MTHAHKIDIFWHLLLLNLSRSVISSLLKILILLENVKSIINLHHENVVSRANMGV
jgi:hypothetical protein